MSDDNKKAILELERKIKNFENQKKKEYEALIQEVNKKMDGFEEQIKV